MKNFIYLIRNAVNGKGYIGKTSHPVQIRFKQHCSKAQYDPKSALHLAMRFYGIENFSITEIASCNDGQFLNELEIHFIKFFGTRADKGHGYNLTAGGDGMSGFKRIHSASTKAKIANALRGRKGRPLTESNKIKMQEAAKVAKKRPEVRAKMAEAQRGKKMLPQTRLALKLANSGKARSLETKARISATKRGIPWT